MDIRNTCIYVNERNIYICVCVCACVCVCVSVCVWVYMCTYMYMCTHTYTHTYTHTHTHTHTHVNIYWFIYLYFLFIHAWWTFLLLWALLCLQDIDIKVQDNYVYVIFFIIISVKRTDSNYTSTTRTSSQRRMLHCVHYTT